MSHCCAISNATFMIGRHWEEVQVEEENEKEEETGGRWGHEGKAFEQANQSRQKTL